jgi:hypothetical protein
MAQQAKNEFEGWPEAELEEEYKCLLSRLIACGAALESRRFHRKVREAGAHLPWPWARPVPLAEDWIRAGGKVTILTPGGKPLDKLPDFDLADFE